MHVFIFYIVLIAGKSWKVPLYAQVSIICQVKHVGDLTEVYPVISREPDHRLQSGPWHRKRNN